MITYELFFGLPPYYGCSYDYCLATKIVQGVRPDLNIVKIPQLLKDVIVRC
jgi:hypothetical protein